VPLYGFQLIPWTPLPEIKFDGVDEAEELVDEEDRERLVVEEVCDWKEEVGSDCPLKEDDTLEETDNEIELTVDFCVEAEPEAVDFTELVGCEEEEWDVTEESDKPDIPDEDEIDDICDDVLTLELEAEVIADDERVDDDVELADEGAEDTLEGFFVSPGREGSHGAFISRFSTVRWCTNWNRKCKSKDKGQKCKFENHDE
jgi:hypothetical protein